MAKTPRARKPSTEAAAPEKAEPDEAPKAAAKKKAAKKTAAAPATKKAAKKTAAAPATKKKAAAAPATKKVAKKAAAAPATKKAAKKIAAVPAPVNEQLALSIDVDPPVVDAAPVPARPLQPGDRVPDFSLESDDGQTYSRQSLAGRRFVLYFYPKDDTPGCTREACDFRDHRPQLDAAGVSVLGVSSDGIASHARFRRKHSLDFPLLADPGRTVAQAFGVVGVKKLYGKTNIGVVRSTFVVGPDGVVERTFSPVRVDGHADAVLQAIGAG
jgi:peroxiredoxin Q/BCP